VLARLRLDAHLSFAWVIRQPQAELLVHLSPVGEVRLPQHVNDLPPPLDHGGDLLPGHPTRPWRRPFDRGQDATALGLHLGDPALDDLRVGAGLQGGTVPGKLPVALGDAQQHHCGLELLGIGVVNAARMLVAAGENIDRLPSEVALAHLCGQLVIGCGERVRLQLGPIDTPSLPPLSVPPPSQPPRNMTIESGHVRQVLHRRWDATPESADCAGRLEQCGSFNAPTEHRFRHTHVVTTVRPGPLRSRWVGG
jgi:hypothetical protein